MQRLRLPSVVRLTIARREHRLVRHWRANASHYPETGLEVNEDFESVFRPRSAPRPCASPNEHAVDEFDCIS